MKIKYNGREIPLPAIPRRVGDLKGILQGITAVPVESQKLICSGKLLKDDQEPPSSGTIILMGSVARLPELPTRYSLSAPRPRREIPSQDDVKYTFTRLRVLNGFPRERDAMKLLERVKADVGIRGILRERRWSVGELVELDPSERTILGYNRNRGQKIALRLRFEDAFRTYASVIETLLHELSHMVWDKHDANFYTLNRELTADYARHDWTRSTGRAVSSHPVFQGEVKVATPTIEGGTYRLGGTSDPSLSLRETVARATTLRVSRKEQELTDMCGQERELSKEGSP